MAQAAVLFTEMTSEGEKDDSKDDASVLRRDGDPSCLAAIETTAWQSEDLLYEAKSSPGLATKERERRINRQVMRLVRKK